MGRVITRSSGKSRAEDVADDSNSSVHLKTVKSGGVRKRKSRSAMSKKESLTAHLDESVLSLSLVDSQTSFDEFQLPPDASYPPQTSKESSACSVKLPGSSLEPSTSGIPTNCSLTEDRPEKECSICLSKPLQPVKLPCSHIFCYLCIKGVVQRSVGTCALCRSPIPRNFIFSPEVVDESSQSEPEEDDSPVYKWFYEGRSGGWWEFDPRTAEDIENKYIEDTTEPKVIELLIAGLIFIIDLDAMVQKRKNAQHIQRRLKRDVKDISDKKGVAGISSKSNTQSRRGDRRRDGRQGTSV